MSPGTHGATEAEMKPIVSEITPETVRGFFCEGSRFSLTVSPAVKLNFFCTASYTGSKFAPSITMYSPLVPVASKTPRTPGTAFTSEVFAFFGSFRRKRIRVMQ